MSGVVTVSRLEQLEQLARKVAHELAQERQRVATDCRPARERVTVPVVRTEPADAVMLRRLGISAATVRAWAVETGRLAAGTRGRVPVTLIDEYAEAHR